MRPIWEKMKFSYKNFEKCSRMFSFHNITNTFKRVPLLVNMSKQRALFAYLFLRIVGFVSDRLPIFYFTKASIMLEPNDILKLWTTQAIHSSRSPVAKIHLKCWNKRGNNEMLCASVSKRNWFNEFPNQFWCGNTKTM